MGDVLTMLTSELEQVESRREELRRELVPLDAEAARLQAAIDAIHALDAKTGRPAKRRSRQAARQASPRRNASPSVDGRRQPRAGTTALVLNTVGSTPMTASEVAAATGLPAASVSTTMSKLSARGLLRKADRGYVQV